MDNKLYELTPSQEVICLQTKYTLYKRVVNILFSATSKKELDENFSSTKTTSNEVVNGEVVYTDKYAFSTDGIDYFKIVKRTPSKTLTQTIYVECNDIAINPLDYRDLKPNLFKASFTSFFLFKT